jgi:hypothetical protein
LGALSDAELRRLVLEGGFLDPTAEFVLAERHYRDSARRIREKLLDGFKQEFESRLSELATKLSLESKTVSELRSVEAGVRDEMSQRALDLLCRKGGRADLGVVRKVLRSGQIPFSLSEFPFLGRLGEWDDLFIIIDRVKSLAGPTILSPWGGREKEIGLAARAIADLARGRIRELLSVEMPAALFVHVLLAIPDSEFRTLPNDALLQLLRSSVGDARKVAVLRSVAALSKRRVAECLDAYVTSPNYYYNVSHWLDLGASLTRERATAAARKALAESQSRIL